MFILLNLLNAQGHSLQEKTLYFSGSSWHFDVKVVSCPWQIYAGGRYQGQYTTMLLIIIFAPFVSLFFVFY